MKQLQISKEQLRKAFRPGLSQKSLRVKISFRICGLGGHILSLVRFVCPVPSLSVCASRTLKQSCSDACTGP